MREGDGVTERFRGPVTNWKQVALGERNRATVRTLLAHYPGISRAEIAGLLSLSPMAVTRHVAAIRAEWGADTLPTRRGRAAILSATKE